MFFIWFLVVLLLNLIFLVDICLFFWSFFDLMLVLLIVFIFFFFIIEFLLFVIFLDLFLLLFLIFKFFLLFKFFIELYFELFVCKFRIIFIRFVKENDLELCWVCYMLMVFLIVSFGYFICIYLMVIVFCREYLGEFGDVIMFFCFLYCW